MKKGFIATSLIYSFFLVFCAVLLSYISISVHNKNLINKANEETRNALADKKIGNVSIGSYVKLNLESTLIDTKDINWIIFNTDDDKTELVSSSIVFTSKSMNDINKLLLTFHNYCLTSDVRLLTYNDLYESMKNNAENITSLKVLANIDNADKNTKLGSNYLVMQNGNPKRYLYREPNNDNYSLSEFKNVIFSNSNLTNYVTNADMNVRLVITLSSNIKIVGGSGNYSNPYALSSDSCFEDVSLVNRILAKGYDNKDNYTNPGVDPAMEDEGLRSTKDDYGISYYYRGAVENNYVIFANMCWRIVRITGDGSIKLALVVNGVDSETRKPTCNTSVGNSATLVLKVNGTNVYSFKYNNASNDNAYVGYMYGNLGATTFNDTHENINKSNALETLKIWYDSKFSEENKNKLADVIWCNDISNDNANAFNHAYTGIGTTQSFYDTYFRNIRDVSINPSLICPSVGPDGKLSKFTANDIVNGNGKLIFNSKEYKIGMLTADEMAFAGAYYSSDSSSISNTYLKRGVASYIWSMSPRSFASNKASMIVLTQNGILSGTHTDNAIYIRPVVALKSNTKVTGTGTINDPYVVE